MRQGFVEDQRIVDEGGDGQNVQHGGGQLGSERLKTMKRHEAALLAIDQEVNRRGDEVE